MCVHILTKLEEQWIELALEEKWRIEYIFKKTAQTL